MTWHTCSSVARRFRQWRNTLGFLFGASLATSTSPDRSIRVLGELIDSVSEETLGLHVLVGDCLQILIGRKLTMRPEKLGKFRRDSIAAIEREVPLRERLAIGTALGRAGDPRIVTDLRDPNAYVAIPSGEYPVGEAENRHQLENPILLARYPTTNAQFELFIRDGGYDNQAWWSVPGWAWKTESGIGDPEFRRDSTWNSPLSPSSVSPGLKRRRSVPGPGGACPMNSSGKPRPVAPTVCCIPGGATLRLGSVIRGKRNSTSVPLWACFLDLARRISASRIWPGTSGSCVPVLGTPAMTSVCCGAVPGSTNPGSLARRSAAGAFPGAVTTVSGFVSCGMLSPGLRNPGAPLPLYQPVRRAVRSERNSCPRAKPT